MATSEAFELSRRAWIAVEERDLDGFLALVHEDVWHIVRVRDHKAEWWGSFRTEDEAMAAYRAWNRGG